MYKDIITYELAENKSEEELLTVAGQVVKNWMRNLPGFLKWEIHTNEDGTYTDIVYWVSKEAAKKGEKEMVNIPNSSEWFSCYKEGTISSKNLSTVAGF